MFIPFRKFYDPTPAPTPAPEPTPNPANPPADPDPSNPNPSPTDPPADPEPQDPPTEDPEHIQFINRLNELRGEGLAINAQELVDSMGEELLTPEGVNNLIRLAEQSAVNRIVAAQQQEDPRSYAYKLHRASGGTDEEFFKAAQNPILPDENELKNSIDLQKSFVEKVLLNKGLNKSVVTATLSAMTPEQIKELAVSEYDLVKERDAALLAEKAATLANQKARAAQEEQELTTSITDSITNGTNMSIVIPESERAEFFQFIAQKVWRMPDGSFALVETLDKDHSKALQAEYLKFKKGDLDSLVRKRAASTNANRLRVTIKKTAQQTPPTPTPDPTKKVPAPPITSVF